MLSRTSFTSPTGEENDYHGNTPMHTLSIPLSKLVLVCHVVQAVVVKKNLKWTRIEQRRNAVSKPHQ